LQKSVATTVKGHPNGPITQSKEAVKALLTWRGRACDPLPEFVEMSTGEDRLVLVLSNKKDVYYTTTARACSCPAHSFLMAIHANTRGSTFLWLCRRPERSQAASGQRLGGSVQMDRRQMALWRLKAHEKLP